MAGTLLDKLTKVTDADFAKYLIASNNKEEYIGQRNENEYKEWLTTTDGIDAQIIYDRHMINYNLSKLYNTMLDKALNGDVRSAQWIESFAKSDYFKDDTNEIDDFLSGISIKGLE